MKTLIYFIIAIFMFSSVVYGKNNKTMKEHGLQNKSIEENMDKAQRDLNLVHDALSKVTTVPDLPENWKEVVENSVRHILKDPESARFRYPEEQQKYCAISNVGDAPFQPITLVPDSPLLGHSGIVFVNAKNSYGGYVGEEPYWYMITDGKVSLLKNVKVPDGGGVLSSLFSPVSSISDIEASAIRWEGNSFHCK